MALSKQISDLNKLVKRFLPVADKTSNKKSLYSSLSPTQKSEHIEAALQNIVKNDPDIDINAITGNELLDALRKRMYSEQEFLKNNEGLSLLDLHKENPALHQRNLDLEKQADAFLKEHDPEFFEELNQAMKNYDENITGLPQNDLIEYMKSNYDTDMSEAFNQAAANQYKKDFIKNLYDNEFDNVNEYYPDNTKLLNEFKEAYNKDAYFRDPTTEPHKTFIRKDINGDPFDKNNYDIVYHKPARLSALEKQIEYNELHKNQLINPRKDNNVLYELSKNPISDQIINFPETSLNKRYHNVAVPKGKYYFEGQHKPGDYYHNILWNYINKGPNRDALLDEFFKDILHKETPKNPQEKFNVVKKYKDALDKRRLDIDMKNIPYNKHKFNHMKDIEEYFDSLRPTSFEDFESKTLSPSSLPDIEHDYYNFIRNKATTTGLKDAIDVDNIDTLHKKALKADKVIEKYKKENALLRKLYKKD